MKNSIFILLCTFSLMMTMSACKKKQKNGTLMFHMHTNIENKEVENYGDTFVLTGGRRIVVKLAQLYISGIQLVKSDGSTIDAPAVNILKVKENEVYTIGEVTAGIYSTIKFNVGLSSSTNASTPGSSDAALNKPEMWFGSSAQPQGFVFVNFQGSIDTAAIPSVSNTMVPFVFKIGTNAMLRNVQMPALSYTVLADQAVEEHLIIDYAKLLNGIQLNNPNNLTVATAADNTNPVASQIANNISSCFLYE